MQILVKSYSASFHYTFIAGRVEIGRIKVTEFLSAQMSWHLLIFQVMGESRCLGQERNERYSNHLMLEFIFGHGWMGLRRHYFDKQGMRWWVIACPRYWGLPLPEPSRANVCLLWAFQASLTFLFLDCHYLWRISVPLRQLSSLHAFFDGLMAKPLHFRAKSGNSLSVRSPHQ